MNAEATSPRNQQSCNPNCPLKSFCERSGFSVKVSCLARNPQQACSDHPYVGIEVKTLIFGQVWN